jgi:hypothetical protein
VHETAARRHPHLGSSPTSRAPPAFCKASVIATVTLSHSTEPSCAMPSRPSAAPRSTPRETPFFVAFPTPQTCSPGCGQGTASPRPPSLARAIGLRVRMGIHTGTPEISEQGYVCHPRPSPSERVRAALRAVPARSAERARRRRLGTPRIPASSDLIARRSFEGACQAIGVASFRGFVIVVTEGGDQRGGAVRTSHEYIRRASRSPGTRGAETSPVTSSRN